MPDVTVTPGVETSEYKETQSTGTIAKIMVALGTLVTLGGAVEQMLGNDSKFGIVAGAIVIIAGGFIKLFSGLGYNKGRSIVKASAAAAVAKLASPKDSSPAQ